MLMSDIADHFISSEIKSLKLKAAGTAELLSASNSARWHGILTSMENRHPEFSTMAVWDKRHGLIASAGKFPAAGAMNDKYVQQAFQGKTVISSTIQSPEGLVFYLAAPLPGTNDRALILTLPCTYFSELLSTFLIWNTGHIFMDDAEGRLIANPRPQWVADRVDFIHRAAIDRANEKMVNDIRQALDNEAKIVRYSISGVPRLCAYRPVSGSEEGWLLGVVAPLPESPFRYIDSGLIVVGIVSLFLSLIAAVIASGFIKKPFEEIAKLKEEAEKNSKFKSDFLANMSHEMRTPLTAVLGLTELTLGTVQLDDEAYSNLAKVHRAGETLLNLINDVLDISKIEADKFELNLREYDLPSLLNDTITQSVLYIGEKPVELVLNINTDLPNYLYGDELRIKQILNNLLSNAFKFTREGTVELGVQCERSEHDEDTVWLTAWVRDTGIGIKPEEMNKLFTLYGKMEEESSRGDANRRTEGTGLGLSISKKVAEMMDGSITVESEYKKGSVFTVKLKQKYVSEATIDLDVVESLKNFHYSIQKFENTKIARINLSYARVLVVDDIPTNLDVTKGLMGLYGLKVDCVTSGQQAIDAIRGEKVKYSAIFMDHMMPEMDGIEATRIIREIINTEYAKTIPIIALTANAIVGNEEMFLSKGFQAFISKPIDLARLDAILREWVRDKEAEALLPDQLISAETRHGKERRILFKNIPGLDIDKGIARFDFNENAYLDVLRSYAKNTRTLLETIKEVNADNLDKYTVTVHGIKGSSYGIFAETAGRKAEDLENAAIAGDYEFVSSNNQNFLDTVFRLISDIEDALSKIGVEQKPIKDTPDEALLANLLAACESYDIDEIDTAMAEIENYEYKSDDGLVIWLRENVDQGKYKSVIERLS
ncbi:MAG: ATP-binding protein [Leptospirales bacterium]|nr:ATP-binding protein [Leptospirales bacterium]